MPNAAPSLLASRRRLSRPTRSTEHYAVYGFARTIANVFRTGLFTVCATGDFMSEVTTVTVPSCISYLNPDAEAFLKRALNLVQSLEQSGSSSALVFIQEQAITPFAEENAVFLRSLAFFD